MLSPNDQALAIRAAILETEIKFHDDAPELIARFKAAGREITFDEAGKPTTSYDSQHGIPLSLALTRWAVDDRTIADGRTLPKGKTDGRPATQSRSDYPDAASKSAFINTYGLAAWESMPAKAKQTSELKYVEDFWALPTSEKVRITESNPGLVASLPRRPKVSQLETVQARQAASKAKHRAELDLFHADQVPELQS